MVDRPIIFSAPMVRALLDGRKTQTRRKLPVPPPFDSQDDIDAPVAAGFIEPKYRRGDRLYVREAWAALDACTHNDPGAQALADRGFYRADHTVDCGDVSRWRPSIHMPRWASRLTLTVTDVRVQRLQDISEADAVAEGIEGDPVNAWRCYQPEPKGQTHWACPRESFRTLWNSLHGPDAWDANPWVCALSFTVHRGNIDQMGEA
ncbi:hypothetical protein [Roseinatronobacter bogoriensis]|uniref:hypothetical protein n=1 Tax=Roseinatronobacter bogoriensis TaxID=119542 RepID=UPI0010654F27|nr:hypothetical protein [Rhodobaca bogoriensis]TDY65763.1 hypothetical protein EV660_11731 [Rhodobaca bogoriensis DSM 18756]